MIETHPPSSPPAAGAPVDESLPSMPALVCLLASREYYRPALVSTNEVFCGPDCRTVEQDGRVSVLQSPVGSYDLRALVGRLPASQRPELILVKADSTGRNLPRHLDAFHCPKVLLVGDTHHQREPVRNLLRYASEERFDLIVFDHTRQHAHFFVEAGFDRVAWIPGFDLSPHEQPWHDEVERQVVFVGQVGRFHPYRQLVLDGLARAQVPVKRLTAPPPEAAAIYARSLVSLNCSLNGDLNLRVFEVLSSGGFLLTDRLSPQAGLDRLFRDGEHLVCYDGVEDLQLKIEHYLAHPAAARRIASAGRDEYLARHRPARKIAELMGLLGGGQPAAIHRIEGQGRAVRTGASREAVAGRAAVYEHLQEVHRIEESPAVLFAAGVEPRLVADAADLPRLRILLERGPGGDEVVAALAAAGIAQRRVSRPGPEELEEGVVEFDVVVTTAAALLERRNDRLLEHADALVLAGEASAEDAARAAALLRGRGFQPAGSGPPAVFHLTDEVTIGERHFAAGEPEEAARHFQQAIARDPENVRALNNLGVVSHLFGDPLSASQFVERALSLDRRDPETLLNLAELRVQLGQGDEARRLFQHLEGRALASSALAERMSTLAGELPAAAPAPTPMPARPSRRVLLVTNLFPPQELGGYGRLMQDFALRLAARGHTVEVLTSDTAYLGALPEREPGIGRSLRLFGGWRDGSSFNLSEPEIQAIARENAAEVERTIARFRPDVCLLGNLDFLGPHSLFATLRHIPVVHHLGNRRPGYMLAETPRDPRYRLACASRWLADKLLADGYPLEDVAVVYPGAHVGAFRMPVPPSRRRLRIAFASLLMPYKGAHVLVDALFKLAGMEVDFTCTIAGATTKPGYVEALRKAVRTAGLEHRIHFPGNLGREELKDLFGRSNVLVFPTEFEEPFGISQVEAMAAGLTVVGTATGGAREVLEHEVTGLVFPKGDFAALAEALASLPRDRERWTRLAENGQRRAIDGLDIEYSIDELERHFTELLDGAGAKAPASTGNPLAPPREQPSDAEARRLRDLVVETVAAQKFGRYGDAARLGQRLGELEPALERDVVFQRALAYAAWVARDHRLSVAAGERAIALDPSYVQSHLTLGWAHLTAGQFPQALAALSAGLVAAPDDPSLKLWRRLAQMVVDGVHRVEFAVDGQSYTFELSFFTGQAMEASVHHAQGTFTELEELRFLRDEVKSAAVIVEVGTLVGNHTVFLTRNLAPRKVYCLDADPRSIDRTTRNFRLNLPEGGGTRLVTINKAVGDSRRMIELGGRMVRMTTLSSEIPEPVDFVKIDVDGMELQVLEGARELFRAHRPRALIEVSHENAPAFRAWIAEVGYEARREFRRAADTNFYVVPKQP